MPESQKNKILLHACCAICSAYPIERLREEGFEPVIYFYNPNIYTYLEYEKRLNAERILCREKSCLLIEEKYEPEEYYDFVKGLEDEPERGMRCDKCFEMRLKKSAIFAKENGFEMLTTSIVISPHKNYEKITQIGERVCNEVGIRYLAINFRKQDGFLKTNQISKELNLYRQKYCGCKFALMKTER